MKTLQSINTILLTLVLLVVGIAGFALQADACQCEFALYTDQRASGVNGDTLTVNTWNVRTINTDVIVQVGSPPSISRSGNEITLQEGTYFIHVIPISWYARLSKVRLRTTDNQTLAVSHSYYMHEADGTELLTYIVVPSPTTFRIEHFITYPYGSSSGGIPVSSGEPEVYLTIRIVKVTSDACH